jgi:hypothetical protein
MCGGRRVGRARARRIIDQSEAYEQTLPPGPFRRPRKAPEASVQIQVARYLAKALPEGFFFTCFPAGGGGRIRGARLKQMGLKAGLPDLVVFTPHYDASDDRCGSPILWLELKAKAGSLSQVQKEVHKQLLKLGHQVVTVKTLDEVQDALADFCFPEKLRARVAV